MRNLKRVLSLALAMVMVIGMMVMGASAASADFVDGDEISYVEAVDVVSGLGIMIGDEKDNFNATDILTREQAAKIMAYIMLGKATADKLGKNTQIFTDVPAGKWSAGYIAYCANVGLIAGNGDGTFAPEAPLTGVAFAKLLLVAAGYDAAYEGYTNNADWATNIAVDALENGMDVKGVALANALTREQAAQMILNTMDAFTVRYIKGDVIGTIGAISTQTLFKDKYFYNLYKDTRGGEDDWGRPYTYAWKYQASKNSKTTTLYYAWEEPVAVYTVATSDCDIGKDMGLKTSGDIEAWYNGNESETTITLTRQAKDNGDQGTLLEVYEDRIVLIDTYLAVVTDVTEEKLDKNDHVITPASTTLDVWYDSEDPEEVDIEDETGYAEGTYVLVYVNEGEDYVEIVAEADMATAKLNAFNDYSEKSTIGGEKYDWAAHYYLENPGTVGKTYHVFTDLYGNLIGLVEPAKAAAVYTILDCGVEVTNGFNPYYAAMILDLKTGELEEVKVADYDNINEWTDDEVTYEHHIVSYVIKGGKYTLKNAADERAEGGYIVKGTPRIYNSEGTRIAVTNNSTVYAVEVKEGVYEMYTGYKSIPSIEFEGAVEVLFGKDGYADLVYIDATDAMYAGSSVLAYVMPATADKGNGELDDGTKYDIWNNVVINGEVVTVDVEKGYDLSAAAGKGVYLVYDADGLVVGYKEIKFEARKTVEENNSDEVVYFVDDPAGYVVDEDTVIWIIDPENSTAKVGEVSDLEKDVQAAVTIAKDGKTLEIVIIWA